MSNVVSAFVGAVFGYIASYAIERFKRRNAINDAQRKAYATWFTAEALMHQRILAVCERLVGFPKDWEKHKALVVEIGSLVNELQTLVTAMNEAFLMEKSSRVRRQLSILNDFVVNVMGTLDFAARHYGENLEFHEVFGTISDDALKELPAETRDAWNQAKEKFEEHDAKCPFKSEEFRTQLKEALIKVHEQATKLREILAVRLSV